MKMIFKKLKFISHNNDMNKVKKRPPKKQTNKQKKKTLSERAVGGLEI